MTGTVLGGNNRYDRRHRCGRCLAITDTDRHDMMVRDVGDRDQ